MTIRLTLSVALATVVLAARPARSQTIYALMPSTDTPTFGLATFNAASPGTLTRSPGYISGLGGLSVAGIEVRPATGQLYLLGYSASLTSPQARLFVLNPTTNVATPAGPALALPLGNSPVNIGFDFDPVADIVRVVGNTANFRLDPTTGGLAATDLPLAYASTDANASQAPNVGTIAYSNSYSGSTTTVLYGVDKAAGRLVTQSPPNTGTLHTVGPLGISLNTALTSFTIDYNSLSSSNTLYLVRSVLAGQFTADANLYTLNPTTGAASLLGPIGAANGLNFISDIAVARTVVSATRTRAEVAIEAKVYPNPATESTNLTFKLMRPGRVTLDVLDVLGRLVHTQEAGLLPAGPQTLRWSPPANRSGLYMVRLSVDGQVQATSPVQLAN